VFPNIKPSSFEVITSGGTAVKGGRVQGQEFLHTAGGSASYLRSATISYVFHPVAWSL